MTQRVQPDVLAAIALGGIVGATARYELAQALPTSPGTFPWPTFWTNMSGSLALGFLLVLLLDRTRQHRLLRPFLATGILGAFTTMSTYLVETAVLIKDGHPTIGVTYGLSSLAVGLFLAFAGMAGARRITQRR
jgi:fluoride exporter